MTKWKWRLTSKIHMLQQSALPKSHKCISNFNSYTYRRRPKNCSLCGKCMCRCALCILYCSNQWVIKVRVWKPHNSGLSHIILDWYKVSNPCGSFFIHRIRKWGEELLLNCLSSSKDLGPRWLIVGSPWTWVLACSGAEVFKIKFRLIKQTPLH